MKNLILLFAIISLSACSPTLRTSYKKLSEPEKKWAAFHPFKAKRAYSISIKVEALKDSLSRAGIIGHDNNGGHLDAFKHSYWMARLTQDIGKRAAYSLGKAHEKGNYQTFIERQFEDGHLPDKPSTEMDLFNNTVGIKIGSAFNRAKKSVLIQKVLDSLQEGKLRILNKDKDGFFLDCQNKRIPLDSLKNKWDTKKCLVPSDK